MSTIFITIVLILLGAYILTNFVACFSLCWITKEHTDTIEKLSKRVSALEKLSHYHSGDEI